MSKCVKGHQGIILNYMREMSNSKSTPPGTVRVTKELREIGILPHGGYGDIPKKACVRIFPPSLHATKLTSTGENLEPPDLLDLCSLSLREVEGPKRAECGGSLSQSVTKHGRR